MNAMGAMGKDLVEATNRKGRRNQQLKREKSFSVDFMVNSPLIRPYFLGGWPWGGYLRFP